ncbi:MAG TPA: TAXI family TRAP transporter solute-binding subunit [Thermoanaerobaculia bacterium]|nr:TAXI family TRAP transporter solute-binding subunit [Thermoanaerobaculia bacterium]
MSKGGAGMTVLMLLAVSACGGSGGGRSFLSFGLAPTGGAFFVVGSALVEVLNGDEDESWNVTPEATSGSQENIRRLASGELDFALSNASITYFAARGSEGWDREYPVRSVMTLAPNVTVFVTQASSGVKTMGDLRGRRVVIGPAGAGFEYFVRPLLQAHGIAYGDFTELNASQSAAVDMLADGAAAAALLGGAVPTASITQASSSMDVFFVPYDPDALDGLASEYVFFEPATIPAGTYRNQAEDFRGLNVGSMHIITSADQDEDLVYRVTRALYENREQVMQRHAAGAAINPTNVGKDTGTPFHPGAVRYYREIGIWSE